MRRFEIYFKDPLEGIPVMQSVTCSGADTWLSDGFWELRFQNPRIGPEDKHAIGRMQIAQHDLIAIIESEVTVVS